MAKGETRFRVRMQICWWHNKDVRCTYEAWRLDRPDSWGAGAWHWLHWLAGVLPRHEFQLLRAGEWGGGTACRN